jgi:polyhydroxyalkanoate synthase subunit PhaC
MATIKGEDTRRRRPPAGKRAEEAAPTGGPSANGPESSAASGNQAPADGQTAMGLPTPEAALGLWMSWMRQNMGGFAPNGSTE